MDMQLLDEAFLKEWYHSPSGSTGSSSGEDEVSNKSEYTTLPRGNPDPKSVQVGKKGSVKGTVVTATVPVVAGGSAKVPRRRRGPAKGGVKQKGTKSGGMPRGISKSRFYDSDSSEPHIPTSRSEEEADTPACQEGPGGWLEGPRDAPDGFVHTCRLCRCKDCCAAIAGWILRC